ncbi:MAG TPA: iron ABC transporter permease [Candidatus Binatia bacterium]|jgi:iron(III) transport system permease protein|nr:iron ABC transporter permease [Candidatus Binatia bacterium]
MFAIMMRNPAQLLFLFTTVALAYLVLPPFFFILHTSLVTDRGLQAGSFTIQHFLNIIESLGDVKTLLWNSMVFSIGSSAVAIAYGTTLAWLAERSDAPFRKLAYVSAYVSFAIPGIIKVVGWIMLLGPKAGILNAVGTALTGAPFFNIFTLGGMILVESFLWIPIVFLLMSTPFRSMDPSLEEAATTAGSSGWQVFQRVTFPLAMPSVLAVLILTFIRSLEAFEIPALIGIPAGVEVLTTKIYLQIKGGLIPKYGEASAYSIILIVLVALGLIPYYRITSKTYKFTTISGKNYRPHRVELGKWRWLGGLLMLVLPFLQLFPIAAIAWSSFLPFAQVPSRKALELLTFNNYVTAFNDSGIIRSIMNSITVSVTSATIAVAITFFAAWLIVRASIKGRWILDQMAMLPLVFPGIVMGIAILKMYLLLPIPVYGTIWILVLAFIARYVPYGIRFSHSALLSLHKELEEGAMASGATWFQMVRHVVVPLIMPALLAGWIYIFLITFRELSIALLLYSPGSQVVAVTIWELWDNGHVGELAAFSLVIAIGTIVVGSVFLKLAQRHGLQD